MPVAPHHQLEHVVRHVARMAAQPVGRGVAEDDGGLGQLQSGLHGGHGYVGQIDDDAQPIHLLHHTLRGDGAQRTQRARASSPGGSRLAHMGWQSLRGPGTGGPLGKGPHSMARRQASVLVTGAFWLNTHPGTTPHGSMGEETGSKRQEACPGSLTCPWGGRGPCHPTSTHLPKE